LQIVFLRILLLQEVNVVAQFLALHHCQLKVLHHFLPLHPPLRKEQPVVDFRVVVIEEAPLILL
jgi:hypothetical protein